MELNSLTEYTPLSDRLKALGNLIACVIECKCVYGLQRDWAASKCVNIRLPFLP